MTITKAQQEARIRNWRLFRLRGIHDVASSLLDYDLACLVRDAINEQLARLNKE